MIRLRNRSGFVSPRATALRRVIVFILPLFAAACAVTGPVEQQSVARPELSPQAPHARESRNLEAAPESVTANVKPEPEPDPFIWSRLRNGFQLPYHDDHPRVQEYLDWHARHPHYLARVSERAAPYLHLIIDELGKRQMPLDLALLPAVESSYVPFAYSSGKAAGLWQFIPTTGKIYGLQQTWWYDGRRDIIASTRAALDFLKALHDQFDNDWLLALAAYNSGPGTVSRAIKANAKKGLPTDYWHLKLPKETVNYVPKLLAMRAVVQTPLYYGVELFPIADAVYLTSVDTDSQIDLGLAAELADLDIELLYKLNPGFKQWATAPDGPHRLLLPIESAAQFEAELDELDPDKRVTWHRHRIRSGETLGHIAINYRTSVQMLKQVNALKGHGIRAGRFLMVPRAVTNMTPELQQGLKASREQRPSGHRTVHRVASGESLWTVARHYNLKMESIARWNSINVNDILRPGDKLVLWGGKNSKPVGKPTEKQVDTETVAERKQVSYSVKSGDSLYTIARRFNVTIEDLRRWNGLNSSNLLKPGQAMTLYVAAYTP